MTILDADFEDAKEFALPPIQPCICRECDEKAKVMLDELMRTTDYMELHKNDEVWRRWLSLRTICEKQPYVYSWPQAAYHYSKNQKYLIGEKERMQKGTFELDYDWVSDFNKDILGCMNKNLQLSRQAKSIHEAFLPYSGQNLVE